MTVIVGFLESNRPLFKEFEVIIASPTYVGQEVDARNWDHTQLVIDHAAKIAEDRWPFQISEPIIVKTSITERLVGHTWKERREIAENDLRNALKVVDKAATLNKNILVYDDVFTEGFTLREVADCLINQGGARSVSGISIVRQPFIPRG
jgi:predicted amidophosphoribosyltransferase